MNYIYKSLLPFCLWYEKLRWNCKKSTDHISKIAEEQPRSQGFLSYFRYQKVKKPWEWGWPKEVLDNGLFKRCHFIKIYHNLFKWFIPEKWKKKLL